MGSLTAQTALDRLAANPDAYSTKESLISLVDELDIHAKGAVSVFYGGKVQGVGTGDIVQTLLKQDMDIRALDKTQAFKFLESEEFQKAVGRVFRVTRDELIDGSPAPARAALVKEANDWLYGATDSPWSAISKNFAAATEGDVAVIAPEAKFERIFGQTELPELLRPEKVTRIQGYTVSELKALGGDGPEAARRIFEITREASKTHLAHSVQLTNQEGRLTVTGFDHYFEIAREGLASYLARNAATGPRVYAVEKQLEDLSAIDLGIQKLYGVDTRRDPLDDAKKAVRVSASDLERFLSLSGKPFVETYEALEKHSAAVVEKWADQVTKQLDPLIQARQARMDREPRPGRWSLPGTKRDWQARRDKMHADMGTLEAWRAVLREIQETSSWHGTRVEALGASLARAANPEIAARHDDQRKAEARQELAREVERQKRQRHERGRDGLRVRL